MPIEDQPRRKNSREIKMSEILGDDVTWVCSQAEYFSFKEFLKSESPEEAGVPPESNGCGTGCDGCGTCAGCKCGGPLTPAYQDGCGETTGCDPKTAAAQKRQWIVLASFCLSLTAFILNTVDAMHNKYKVYKKQILIGGGVQLGLVNELAHGGFDKPDKILTAGFG